MPPEILPLDAFVRAIGASRMTPHALFLGAGASISSGMPSAQMCIWEWKRSIFLTNNIGLEPQFSEITLASVQTRIQHWIDRQGLYPQAGDPSEYSVFIEACYPLPETRRLYFQEKVRQAKPHIGYQLIGELAAHGIIRSVWTTNFDQLTSRALGDQVISPIEVGIDSAHRAVRAAHVGELLIVSLHGDYRYDSLKNTTAELQKQEERLERALVQEITNAPTIVCGYSGRDISVMNAFQHAYSRQGAGTLYWCVQDADNIAPQVRSLINFAQSNGRTAYLVPIQGFDDLLVRLALHCLDRLGQERVTQLIAQNVDANAPRRIPFQIEMNHPTAVLKSNAFEIECPSEVITFEPRSWPDSKVWRWVRDQTSEREVVAAPFKGQIFALGTVDDIRACFGDNIRNWPQRTPLAPVHLRREDGAITSLLREALVRSMTYAYAPDVQSDGSRELWLTNSSRQERLDGKTYWILDSIYLTLRQIDSRTFIILKPTIKVLTPAGNAAPREVTGAFKLRILGYQHNKEFNDAVNKWRRVLLVSDTA